MHALKFRRVQTHSINTFKIKNVQRYKDTVRCGVIGAEDPEQTLSGTTDAKHLCVTHFVYMDQIWKGLS